MTYKLEPGLSRITSPVRLIFPERTEEYENGTEACDAEFDKKWRVVELRAKMYPVKWTHEFSTIPECGHSKKLHTRNVDTQKAINPGNGQ